VILAGHQPVYLPGIILFNKMTLCDRFMLVGHVQFSPKSWQQRNRIGLDGREIFLSVPVRKAERFGQSIDAVEMADRYWPRKHNGSIRQAYAKRPFFDRYYPALEATLTEDHPNLGALNRALLRLLCEWLEITTPVLESHDYQGIDGHKTDMLIDMCRAVGADRYLSNEGARDYVDEARMAAADIEHCWQDFTHPVYDQGHAFVPGLSVIDLLFNVGPAAARIVRTCGRVTVGAFPTHREAT
jgi:hypothetical protein